MLLDGNSITNIEKKWIILKFIERFIAIFNKL